MRAHLLEIEGKGKDAKRRVKRRREGGEKIRAAGGARICAAAAPQVARRSSAATLAPLFELIENVTINQYTCETLLLYCDTTAQRRCSCTCFF
jgi:hypothetical protein